MNNNDVRRIMSDIEKQSGGNVKPDKNRAKVESMLKGLDEKQSSALKQVLSDPEKSKEILNSPMAKALLKKLMNNG